MIDYNNINKEIKELENLKTIRDSYLRLLNNSDFKKVFNDYLYDNYLKEEVKKLSKVLDPSNKILIEQNLFAISKLQSILDSLLADDLETKLSENENLIKQNF